MNSLSKEAQKKDPEDKKEKKSRLANDLEWLKLHLKPKNVKKTRNKNNQTLCWFSEDPGGHCGGEWQCHKPSECEPNFYEKNKENKWVLFAKKPEATKKKKSMDAITIQVPKESDSDEWWMNKVRGRTREIRSPFMITMALTFVICILKLKNKGNASTFIATIIILMMVHQMFCD